MYCITLTNNNIIPALWQPSENNNSVYIEATKNKHFNTRQLMQAQVTAKCFINISPSQINYL